MRTDIDQDELPEVEGVTPDARTCRRFAFAVDDGASDRVRKRRRRALAEYVLDFRDGSTIVDDWQDERGLWIVAEVTPAVRVDACEHFARMAPHFVPGTFAVDRW